MAERDTTNLANGATIRTGFTTTLVAPGDVTSADRSVGFSNGIIWIYTIATINTNVGMLMHVSHDGTTYGADPATVVTHTANGTYALKYLGTAPFARLEFDSESGGTAAVITVLAAITF